MPDADVLSAALRQIAAVRRDSGASLWISDFARLRDPSACPAMLQCVDPDSPMGLRQDAIASEAAAFTREELSAALAVAGGLGGLSSGHATPLPYLQAYWMFGAKGEQAPAGKRPAQLHGQARREAALLRWGGFTAKPF